MSWPPTPLPPTSIAEAEATLRSGAMGPPSFGDDDPWDFVLRWPDDVVESFAWPAVSKLLEDSERSVRERALRFLPLWRAGASRAVERLIEVATQRAQLFRDASQVDDVATALSNLAFEVRAERPRIAKVILALSGDLPLCRGGVALIAQYEPHALIERAKRWKKSDDHQLAIDAAAAALAAYHRALLPALVEALSAVGLSANVSP